MLKFNFNLEETKNDFRYAIKVFFGMLSGYDGLKERDGDVWENLDLFYYDKKEIFESEQEERRKQYEVEHELYYVCIQFGNGRHLPVPIYDDPENSDIGFLQTLAIFFCKTFILFAQQNRKIEADIKVAYVDWEYPSNLRIPPPPIKNGVINFYRWLKIITEIRIGGSITINPIDWRLGLSENKAVFCLGPLTYYIDADND